MSVRSAQSTFRQSADRRSPRRVKESAALRFYQEVLGLDHLHYGLWQDDDPRTLEGLQRAQQRYADRLISLVPEGVRSVLDVGAGTGATSRQLLEAGYEVEGLSPDPHQETLYRERVGRPFHLGRFQEFEPAHGYDLVLMSESSQYIWIEEVFGAVRRTVDDGWLLIADYFVLQRDGSRMAKSGHLLEEFRAGAREAGFELEVEEDITEQTAPTLELARRWYDDHLLPALALGRDMAQARRPWVFGLLRRWLGGKVERELGKLEGNLSPDDFRRVKRYLLMRFRVPPR